MARADELIRLLDMAPRFIDGNPDRNHIDGLEHNLRVATLARRWVAHSNCIMITRQQLGDQVIFMGLVHDLARPLTDAFHGEAIAEIVRDMVHEDIYHVLRTHGQYQAAYVHKDPSHILEPFATWAPLAKALCAWELASFAKDWKHETMSKTEAVTLIYKICDGRD